MTTLGDYLHQRGQYLALKSQTIEFYYAAALSSVYSSVLYQISHEILGGITAGPRRRILGDPKLPQDKRQLLDKAHHLHELRPLHVYILVSDKQLLATAKEALNRWSFYAVIDNTSKEPPAYDQRAADFVSMSQEWSRKYKQRWGIAELDDNNGASVRLILIGDNVLPEVPFFDEMVERHRPQLRLFAKHTHLRPIVEFWLDTELEIKSKPTIDYLDIRNVATVDGYEFPLEI